MKFLIFVFAAVLVIYNPVFGDDFEVTKENIVQSIQETAEELNAREYLPKDCFRLAESQLKVACMALMPVWRWDVKEKKCVKDNYGGCNRTKNNFSELEECNRVAKPVCEKLTDAQIALAQ